MTTHEKCLRLRKENPSMKIIEIAKLIGKDPATVLFHLNPKYRESHNKSRQKYRTNRKREFVEKLGGKCQICGYNKCLGALQFHHQNPKEKEFTLANFYMGREKIEKEIKKCILVCSNCHWEIHMELNN